VRRGADGRRGRDTRFAPASGSGAAGDEVELLAINIHKSWYKIKYYNGDGGVCGRLLETRGNLDDLPVLTGPPLPEPTAIPATATPALPAAGDINLVAGNMRNSAGTIICNVSFTVAVDVANHGSARAPGGTVRFLDYATKRDGGRLDPEDTITTGTFPPIDPGQTVEASASFTITRHYGERHIIWANVNHDGAVPEGNKSDNENHFTYDLQRGDC